LKLRHYQEIGERLEQHARQLQRELREFRDALLNEYRAKRKG